MEEIIDLFARERLEGYVAKFFQTIALPKEVLTAELEGLKNGNNFGNFKYINQWRIDYPKKNENEIPDERKTILSIAHKILTRGDYTTVSPFLEEKLASIFENVNKGEFNPSAYELTIDSNDSTFYFDSDVYEKPFYEKVLPQILGNSFKRFVLPQVEFRSLEKNYISESGYGESIERVDFLLTTNKSKVVVELDGEEHKNHIPKDDSRKKRLFENGITEIRINNSDLDNPECNKIQDLKKKFANLHFKKHEKGDFDKFLNSIKLAHQFQITLVELLFEGVINDTDRCKISYDFSILNEYTPKDIRFIIEAALSDLKQLISKLSELYDEQIDINKLQMVEIEHNDGCIVLTYNDNFKTEMVLCIIQDISFPKIIAKELKSAENIKINKEPKTELLEYFLEYIFGYESFREGQLDSIKRILLNKDTITLLSTGAGKSLIFQLATFLLPGISVIIVPIKSLMHDQVENLERRGITRAIGLSSDIDSRIEKKMVQRLLSQGQYLFIYVAPERFLIDDFRNVLQDFTKRYIVSIIVIDEAHCVSEWGHDFRTAYLTIGKNSREYCKNRDSFPPLIALTGTASENVLLDIKEDLEIKEDEAIISSKTFDRKELHFNIYKCKTHEKFSCVKNIIIKELPEKLKTNSILISKGKATESGILFCPFTTNNERGVNYYINKIKENFGEICKPYHSKVENRIENARNFQKNKFPLIIATKGYGMGIDKPNIRYIIHINLPQSVEAFYQEAGRAGRDGEPAECFIIYSYTKDERNSELLDINNSLDEIIKRYNQKGTKDDVRSLFWFHNNTFKGKADELNIIKGILNEIGDLNKEYLPFSSPFDLINSTIRKKLFSWDGIIQENDITSLRNCLIQKYGIDWVRKAKIGYYEKAIVLYTEYQNQNLRIKFNDEKTIFYFKNDGNVFHFYPRIENNSLNIYENNPSSEELRQAKQKAIFRLTAIGVITNYSINYGSDEFNLTINKISKEKIILNYFNYVKKYNHQKAEIERRELENNTHLDIKDFIIFCCDLFLNYVYDYIEKGRRQALSTMLEILEKALAFEDPDKLFREEISNFLKRTYSKQLIGVANAKDLSEMRLQIIELLEGSNLNKPVSDYKSLNSQISRTMEDFPESIGLFLLRAYVRVRINENDENLILNDINQFLFLSFNKYKFGKEEVYPLLSWILMEMVKIKKNRGSLISKKLINEKKDDELTIRLIRDFDKDNLLFYYGKMLLLKNIYMDLEANFYGRK